MNNNNKTIGFLFLVVFLATAGCNDKQPGELPSDRLQFGPTHIGLDASTIVCGDAGESQSNGYIASANFRPQAAKRFQDITTSHVGKSFDIILNDTVILSPRIIEPILGNSITISGKSDIQITEISRWFKSLENIPGCQSTSY